MAALRKFSEELKERATRLTLDARRDPGSKIEAIKRIADRLGINPEALRTWVRQAEVDTGEVPRVTTVDAQRIVELEREVKELGRANEILKTAGTAARRRCCRRLLP